MYLQGTCGDVNFRREFNGTERRLSLREPFPIALQLCKMRAHLDEPGVVSLTRNVSLPTRRWERQEILCDREEGLYRLKTGDTTGWLTVGARMRQPARKIAVALWWKCGKSRPGYRTLWSGMDG